MITIKKTPESVLVFLAGFACGVILAGAIVYGLIGPRRPASRAAPPSDRELIAPYYQPADLYKQVKSASVSAKMRIPVIMYHYVEYVKDRNDLIRKNLDVTPDRFEKELNALKAARFQTYFVKDIPDILNGSIQYEASRSAVLTFDDGYDDFYTVVFPLLKKYQVKATVYLIADFIGRPGFMNASQISQLVDSDLVEVGSHTLNHLYLKAVPPPIAEKEIVQSKKTLEQRFHITVKTFAYPYGAFNDAVEAMVKDASYSAAVSVMPGVLQAQSDRFHLYRIRPGRFSDKTIVSALEGMK
ncbi:polysaccharide deacetylase family protein [Patescibacteria group bacterium]|nr:polysaccharide deacetylase family protein [Patescibacteria group bacterium]MCL5091910.1 polysaccharide deacetylase family protein [Patescibacteria group bacterium]